MATFGNTDNALYLTPLAHNAISKSAKKGGRGGGDAGRKEKAHYKRKSGLFTGDTNCVGRVKSQ